MRKPIGTIVNIILPQSVLFKQREFNFTTMTFISPTQDLFYCREFCFIAASFFIIFGVI